MGNWASRERPYSSKSPAVASARRGAYRGSPPGSLSLKQDSAFKAYKI